MTALFYIAAGINHFIHPQTYISLIPPYLPWQVLLNSIAGSVEISAGVLLFFSKTRKLAAIFLITMLIAFIPAHIYMIQKQGCVSEALCVPVWVAWLRLPLQFILMILAWKVYEWNKKPEAKI